MNSAPSVSKSSLLTATELTRSFGARKALAGVSFALEPGECLAVFGPNGAGKTTLLRVLAGLLKPTSGSATLGGVVLPGGADVRRNIGLISHNTMLYDALSARENVAFAARLYGVREVSDAVTEALDRMSMLERANVAVRSLSRGMQQRVSIARAMVHRPRLVLADEPYSGLDESGASALTSLLQELRASGAAVVIVTHNIREGLALATRSAIMNRGRFIRYDVRDDIDDAGYAGTYRDAVAANG